MKKSSFPTFMYEFTWGYKIWYIRTNIYGITSESHTTDKLEEPSKYVDYGINSVQIVTDRVIG